MSTYHLISGRNGGKGTRKACRRAKNRGRFAIENAIQIGSLAPVSLERIVKVGNAAIEGARELLLSKRQRKKLRTLINNIEHIELESSANFFDIFVEGCQFTPMPSRI